MFISDIEFLKEVSEVITGGRAVFRSRVGHNISGSLDAFLDVFESVKVSTPYPIGGPDDPHCPYPPEDPWYKECFLYTIEFDTVTVAAATV